MFSVYPRKRTTGQRTEHERRLYMLALTRDLAGPQRRGYADVRQVRCADAWPRHAVEHRPFSWRPLPAVDRHFEIRENGLGARQPGG